jgi:glycosyltransferase involved in cell wall biosynthesis
VEDHGREARLLVAGRVLDRDYWRQVRRVAEARPLAGKFEYLGELGFRDKVHFLRRCSAFCVPSRQPEPRGLAMMEAMASGVPVVAPESGVFPEMLSLTQGGLMFRPADPADLAARLSQLMDDPDTADRLGRQGAQGVAEHYSPDRAIDGMAAVLEEAVAKAGRGG